MKMIVAAAALMLPAAALAQSTMNSQVNDSTSTPQATPPEAMPCSASQANPQTNPATPSVKPPSTTGQTNQSWQRPGCANSPTTGAGRTMTPGTTTRP